MKKEKQINNDLFVIGSYVELNQRHNYLPGTIKQTLQFGGNACMFFLGPPQSSHRVPLAKLKITEFHQLVKAYNFNLDHVIVHGSYLINLANTVKKTTVTFGRNFLIADLKRMVEIGLKTLILHPGSHLGVGSAQAINGLAHQLNLVFQECNQVRIALETMSGKGTQIGTTFEELKAIIEKVDCQYQHLVGVCWDFCHMHDNGYDLTTSNHDHLITSFDQIIGLNKLWVIHVNDSLNPPWSHKDRHANIGYGYIGFDHLVNLMYHPQLFCVTKVLETPYFNKNPIYQKEIDMIRKRNFFNYFPALEIFRQ